MRAETRSDGEVSLKPQSATSIESILSRNLPRIDENIAKKRNGFLGTYRIAFQRPGTLFVFKSEREVVTLSINKEGHASVTRGCPPGPILTLVGPHDSFLTMFQDERNVASIPDSIVILFEVPGMDDVAERIMREAFGRLLHTLFQ